MAGVARSLRRSRAVSASRFKDVRLSCALSVADAGKLFRVTPRTIQNWEAGRVSVPYAAFKLMRILRGYELPGHEWKGYRLVGDTLWSPEGLAFKAADHRWWALTVRMAHEFRGIMAAQRQQQAARPAQAAATRSDAAGDLAGALLAVIPSETAPPAPNPGGLAERVGLDIQALQSTPPTVMGCVSPQPEQSAIDPPHRDGDYRLHASFFAPRSSNTGCNSPHGAGVNL